MNTMRMEIVSADLSHSADSGYVGHAVFQVEGHSHPYEITLQSNKGRDWSYSLNFARESGSEEQISEVEEWLEEDDDAFEALVQACKSASANE